MTYEHVDAKTAWSIMQTGGNHIILDVRTRKEYDTGHIPGAICIPNESIAGAAPEELPDKAQKILIYCRSGRKSREAAQKLADMGYSNITEFGGILDWHGIIPTGIIRAGAERSVHKSPTANAMTACGHGKKESGRAAIMNKNVFRNLSYGVYVISTLDGERGTGCIANSIMQITSEPATIALSMNHDNYTNQCIRKTGKFAISILAETSSPAIITKFGFQSGRDADKFADTDFSEKEGIPVVSDSCGYIVCKVINKMETSTHTVFLGEVIDGDFLSDAPAMTYAYYHNVIKGSSPKNAPTYLPEENVSVRAAEVGTEENTSAEAAEAGAKRWVCSVCGYVYDGDIPFEELPADYACPVCKHGKEYFRQEK